MTTRTIATAGAGTRYLPLAFAAILGLGIMMLAGHVQAAALHDAAHDVRHATGFPCH